ncbi:MAG: hypothetical protein COS99_05350 [Candidatus Omnitrophica bacterium CG07_land_8_20_14_0_80_42_15]|uniref:Xylose isomerase-like TIM barrel domain-containing protein n=1 Tax=Candidatus Aquitaenariimonas noxiae TaxID=1974741 RepID=A0A2J0KSD8_9BACT|nr:MAG: hypothetical protein COS99_05350 [Candidatus Omnitrophica bacterium CG07_land_8_20_14_0_80_42_15]
MKITNEKFFVLITYDLLLKNKDLVLKSRINCSVYLNSHNVLDMYSKKDFIRIRKFFDDNGLLKIVHGPFLDLNPGSVDRKIREASLERFIQALKAARILGSQHIVFHSGFRPDPYKKYKAEWLKNSLNVWGKFIKLAEKEKINVVIENTFEKTPELLVELVRKIDSRNFKICFDGGHFNSFAKIDPLKAFDMIPPRMIGEIHLSDNDGSDDQHLALGEGNIDIDAIFKRVEKLRIDPVITIEPNDMIGAEKDLAYLEKKGYIQ